jgi:hypothetical protein
MSYTAIVTSSDMCELSNVEGGRDRPCAARACSGEAEDKSILWRTINPKPSKCVQCKQPQVWHDFDVINTAANDHKICIAQETFGEKSLKSHVRSPSS